MLRSFHLHELDSPLSMPLSVVIPTCPVSTSHGPTPSPFLSFSVIPLGEGDTTGDLCCRPRVHIDVRRNDKGQGVHTKSVVAVIPLGKFYFDPSQSPIDIGATSEFACTYFRYATKGKIFPFNHFVGKHSSGLTPNLLLIRRQASIPRALNANKDTNVLR